MPNLLLVEDNLSLSKSIKEYLHNYRCYLSDNLSSAYRIARNNHVDVIILDIHLKNESGLDLIKTLRKKEIDTPIIVLSSITELTTVCEGLYLGADGYVQKPFSMIELKARIDALIKRPPVTKHEIIKFHELDIDCKSFSVSRGGKKIDLRGREFQILEYLIRHKDTTISRRQIINNLWTNHDEPFKGTIDVHISNIRKQIREAFGKDIIQTVHGLGYRVSSRGL